MTSPAYRVLIVEDAQAIAQVLRRGLEREGFDVTVANCGSDALRHLQSSRFDFVLSDYQMPDVNGETLCRQTRSGGPNQHVPFALCTAKANEVDIASLVVELGLTNVFVKPFSLREIVAAIRHAVEATPAALAK